MVTLSTTVAVCNVYRPVHAGLILTGPTADVRAVEHCLSWPGTVATASVARLRRVSKVHRFDGNTPLGGFVANLCVELRKAPSVQQPIHILIVVHVFPDVRQVFQHQHWILDRLGVLHDLSGHTVEHLVNLVPQCVTVGLYDSLPNALLKAFFGGKVGFMEPTNGFPTRVPNACSATRNAFSTRLSNSTAIIDFSASFCQLIMG